MYYTIVLIIAVVGLVAALTFVGISLTNGKNKKVFPDYHLICPDYWDISGTVCYPSQFGVNLPSPDKFTGTMPVNHLGVKLSEGETQILSIDIGENNWTGKCEKASWGKRNGIFWDGVVNTNEC
jgi:hypothetical protein